MVSFRLKPEKLIIFPSTYFNLQIKLRRHKLKINYRPEKVER